MFLHRLSIISCLSISDKLRNSDGDQYNHNRTKNHSLDQRESLYPYYNAIYTPYIIIISLIF